MAGTYTIGKKEYMKLWYEKNPHKKEEYRLTGKGKKYDGISYTKEYKNKWAQKPCSKLKAKEYRLKKDYGITMEQYNQMLINQKECCAICNKHQNQLKKKLDIDHNHETGKIRGLLCNPCNQAIGLLKDNSELLQSAINYLKSNE